MTQPPEESFEPEEPAKPALSAEPNELDGLDDLSGFIPPDPNEPPPVELSSTVGDVIPWGTVLLTLSWGAVSFLLAAQHSIGNSDALIAHGASVTQHNVRDIVWRLLGSTFLHSGASHLFFNSVTLLVLGQAVERIYSRWGFWITVALGGSIASLASLVWRMSRHPDVTGMSIGGSGVVFALGGVLLSGAFRLRDRLAPSRARALAAAVLFLALPGFAQGFQRHGTDNMAHAAGLAAGLALGAMLPLSPRLGDRPAGLAVRMLGLASVAALAAVFVRVLRG